MSTEAAAVARPPAPPDRPYLLLVPRPSPVPVPHAATMATAFATAAALPGRAPARRGVAAAAVRPARGLAAVRSTRRCRTSVLRMAEEGAAPEADVKAEVRTLVTM